MDKRTRYSPEGRERTVRLVQEHAQEHGSQWAAIRSIATKVGCTAESCVGGYGRLSALRAGARA